MERRLPEDIHIRAQVVTSKYEVAKKPVCEVCGELSTEMVNDFEVFCEYGRTITRKFGPSHFFCKDHQRDSLIYYRY